MVFFQLKIGAYSETVSRDHGMVEVGARLPVGPPTGNEKTTSFAKGGLIHPLEKSSRKDYINLYLLLSV